MNVAFAGTPDFAATILRGLLDSRHEVGLVISQPDARRGRGCRVFPPPVAEVARSEELPLAQPEVVGEVAHRIGKHDALVVAAYGQILRPDTLYAAERGAWNVHASLLPAYRGAAPIERAIMHGKEETGVSIMRMEEGLDTGPVALQKKIPIGPNTNAGELTSKLAVLGAEAIVEALIMIEHGGFSLTEQDEREATYAARISTEDRVVEWDRPAKRIHDQVRALAPRIGAQAFHPAYDGPIKILRSRVAEREGRIRSAEAPAGSVLTEEGGIYVRCGEGALRIEELQIPGGRRVEAEEFLRGNDLEGTFTRP